MAPKATRSVARRPAVAGQVAEELREKAKEAGAVGRRVTHAQRSLRDSAIVASSFAGVAVAEIARSYELAPRQIRRIVKDRQAAPSVLDERPMELLERTLREYRGLIADFEAMADYYVDSHPSVALGAKRSALETRERLFGLLESMGKMPDNLAIFRAEMELIKLGQLTHDKLEACVAGELSPQQVLVFVEEAIFGSAPVVDAEVVPDPE